MIWDLESVIFETIIVLFINISYVYILFLCLNSYFEKIPIVDKTKMENLDKIKLYVNFSFMAIIMQIVESLDFIFVLFVFSIIFFVWIKGKIKFKYSVGILSVFLSITVLFRVFLKILYLIHDLKHVIFLKEIGFVIIVLIIIRFIILSVLKKLKRKSGLLSFVSLKFILNIFTPTFLMTSIFVMCRLVYKNGRYVDIAFVIFIINIIFVTNFVSVILSLTLIKNLVTNHNFELNQFEHLSLKFENHIRDIHKKQHDFKNHILVMKTLLNGEKYEDLQDYMKKLVNEDMNERTNKFILTGNFVIDAIINSKLSKIEILNSNIYKEIYIPRGLKLENFVLSVTLGNIFDNAIEAMKRIEKAKRYIYILLKYDDKKTFTMCVRNTYNPKYKIDFSKNSTTKRDIYNHGLGLKSVKEVLDNNNGFFEINCDEKFFTVKIMLYGVECK